MYVSTTLTRDELTDVLETVSQDYGGSLTWELEDLGGVRRNRYRLKVGAISDSSAARTSASGRRGPEAAIEYAAQWDTPDAAEGDIVDRDQIGPHWHERTHEHDRYVLTVSHRFGYAALYARDEQS